MSVVLEVGINYHSVPLSAGEAAAVKDGRTAVMAHSKIFCDATWSGPQPASSAIHWSVAYGGVEELSFAGDANTELEGAHVSIRRRGLDRMQMTGGCCPIINFHTGSPGTVKPGITVTVSGPGAESTVLLPVAD